MFREEGEGGFVAEGLCTGSLLAGRKEGRGEGRERTKRGGGGAVSPGARGGGAGVGLLLPADPLLTTFLGGPRRFGATVGAGGGAGGAGFDLTIDEERKRRGRRTGGLRERQGGVESCAEYDAVVVKAI